MLFHQHDVSDHDAVCMQVAERLEASVNLALDEGYRTKDLYTEGTKLVKCSEMGSLLEKYVSA